jgi:hypothetical protein
MVGYMSLEEQVDVDFTRARRRACVRRLMARLRNGPASDGLPCFEDFRKKLGVVGGIRVGRRVVRVEQIAGSVGRSSQFDQVFLPTKASVGERWKRIDRAFHRGEELPPVSYTRSATRTSSQTATTASQWPATTAWNGSMPR